MKFEYIGLFIILWCFCCPEVGSDESDINKHPVQKILHRRKRYVVFPEGSSFSVSTEFIFF